MLTYSYRFWTTLCDRNTEAIIVKVRMSTNSLAKFVFPPRYQCYYILTIVVMDNIK
jgi:hypothetical protein